MKVAAGRGDIQMEKGWYQKEDLLLIRDLGWSKLWRARKDNVLPRAQ